MSPTIGKIAESLAKAQAKIKGAHKDAENPHFRSRYADLASIWDACRAALSDNQIAVVQGVATGHGTAVVTTLVMHASGEFLCSTLEIMPAKFDAQGIGSAITYGRRYGLSAMVGVAPEDDDGNGATGQSRPSPQPQPQPKPPLNPQGSRTTINPFPTRQS